MIFRPIALFNVYLPSGFSGWNLWLPNPKAKHQTSKKNKKVRNILAEDEYILSSDGNILRSSFIHSFRFTIFRSLTCFICKKSHLFLSCNFIVGSSLYYMQPPFFSYKKYLNILSSFFLLIHAYVFILTSSCNSSAFYISNLACILNS